MKLTDIITSEVRVKIIKELFSETQTQLYVRELTRRVGTEINAVRRELKRFLAAGIIRKEQRGNRIYYILREEYLNYYELLSMVSKETGIGELILKNKAALGKVKLALLSTEFAKGRTSKENEVDLLLVGELNFSLVADLVKRETARTGRDINYTILSESDYLGYKKRREYFLLSFLLSPYIYLLGDIDKYLTFD